MAMALVVAPSALVRGGAAIGAEAAIACARWLGLGLGLGLGSGSGSG